MKKLQLALLVLAKVSQERIEDMMSKADVYELPNDAFANGVSGRALLFHHFTIREILYFNI